jgi:hypothetical protein
LPRDRSTTFAGLTIAALILFGAAVRVGNLRVPKRLSEDEQIYTQQALRILKEGFVGGTRDVVQLYLRTPRLAIYPPPTRLGYVFPVVVAMKLSGVRNEAAGAWISCAASMLALGLTALIGWEFFGPWITVIAMWLLSAFPPDLFLAQRCWTDSLVGLAGLLLLYMALKILHAQPVRAVHCIGLAAAGTAAWMVKDTCIVFYGLSLAAALWTLLVRERDRKLAGILVALCTFGAVLDLAIWTVCTGRLALFAGLVLTNLRSTRSNPYTLEWQSTPGHVLLSAFAQLSPLTVLLAALGILIAFLPGPFVRALGNRRLARNPAALAQLAGGTAVLTAVFMFMPHWQSVRFLSPVFGPVCLFAGLAIRWGLAAAKQRVPGPLSHVVLGLVVVIIMAALAADYQRFRIYVRYGISDLSARLVIYVGDRVNLRGAGR